MIKKNFGKYNLHFYSSEAQKRLSEFFTLDPPTPGIVVSFGEGSEGHDAPEKRNAFTNARDQHYAGMYQEAFRMAKEMEAMEKSRVSL